MATASPAIHDGLGQKAIDGSDETPEDLACWSVTTIISVLHKEGLVYWSAEETAKAAVKIAGSLPARLEEDGAEETIRWLRDARFRRPADALSSTSLGTVCHAAAEEYALTGTRPDDDRLVDLISREGRLNAAGIAAETATLNRMLDQFDGWLQAFSPKYLAAEVTVYSPTYRYAGTCDGFLEIDGVRFIIDYKTSRKSTGSDGKPSRPYPSEVAPQLAAYRWAELAAVWRPRRTERFRRRYYLLSPDEQALAVPVPEVDTGLVIHITPEHCDAYPTRCDEEVHRAFLYLQEAFRWANETSRTAMGKPLTPPES